MNLSNIINDAATLTKVNEAELRRIMFKVLEKHPDTVHRLLNPTTVLTKNPTGLFRVVIMDMGPNKIQVIKFYRELTGAGLAEAKVWSEGKPYSYAPAFGQPEVDQPHKFPYGVCTNPLTFATAREKLNEFNAKGIGAKFAIIREKDLSHYVFTPTKNDGYSSASTHGHGSIKGSGIWE